ncbi:MAG: hypothetical protein ACI93N_002455, partial [Flavobacteriaceae bacterium]
FTSKRTILFVIILILKELLTGFGYITTSLKNKFSFDKMAGLFS